MRRSLLIAALSAVLVVYGSVDAAELLTPPVPTVAGQTFVCRVANVGTRAITAQIRVFTFTGAEVQDSGVMSLGPGAVLGFPVAHDLGPEYCRIIVSGSKAAVRGSACVQDSTGCITAVPAQ
jgi:hypothetical protein